MLEFRFRLTPGVIPPSLLHKMFFASWGRVPGPADICVAENELIVKTDTSNSGTFHVLRPYQPLGIVLESTDSLISRSEPYLLVRELGRGMLGRILRKLFEWQMTGFRLSDQLRTELGELSRRFSKAVVADVHLPETEEEHRRLLDPLADAAMKLSTEYTSQALSSRISVNDKLPTLFGVGMQTHPAELMYEFGIFAPHLGDAFHSVLPLPAWNEIEPEPNHYCWEKIEGKIFNPQRFGFQVVLGPILSFDPDSMPQWLIPHLSEPGRLEGHVNRLVLNIAERYGHIAQAIILANRINSFHLKDISIERGLSIVCQLAKLLRHKGVSVPLIIGTDRPWGEYLLDHRPDLDLFQIGEVLIGVPEIDGLLLELNFGLDKNASLPRDPLSIISVVEQWSALGKKMFFSLSVPSMLDSQMLDEQKAVNPLNLWSEGLQQRWTEMLLDILIGRRSTHGIFWQTLQDVPKIVEESHRQNSPQSPYNGLIDEQNTLKLAFKHFTHFRKTYLKNEELVTRNRERNGTN